MAWETRQHVLETREIILERIDALAEARRADRAWLRETLRTLHDREPDRRRRLADLRTSDTYEALYEVDEPLVSVVIPTYRNHALLAQRAIPSVLAQTYQRFEIVIVGDAAPEAARAAVAGFDDPRIRLSNLGLRGPYPEEPERQWLVAGVPPYNEAVRRARGDWIAPLDDDDAFRPDHIERLLDAARTRRLELVYGELVVHEPGKDCTRLGAFPPLLGQFGLQAALYRADLGDIFELELADELFDEPYDWALCRRMARCGVRIGMIDRVVVDLYPSRAWMRSPETELAGRGERARERAGGNEDDDPPLEEWSFAPLGWAEAPTTNRAGAGWDVESVAKMYAERWPGFIANLGGTGPLGALHVAPLGRSVPREDLTSHNLAMVFAYTLVLSAGGAKTLSILDWGGALGHFHALARVLVPHLELDYHCKELPAICREGRRVSPEVTFHEDGTCLQDSYDLVLASGAIQYAEDWGGLLTQLAEAAGRYLLITKVPVTEAPSFVVLQRAHRYGYETEYLGWVLNRDEIRAVARTAGVELVREFFLSAPVEVPEAPGATQHAGFLFRAGPGG